MNKTRILVSTSNNPWFNLAVEEVIFEKMDPRQRVLFIWRNGDTVVIGRAQNPWRECNVTRMEEDNVRLARRRTGGGAVFQDMGNTNFTFMAGKPEYDKTESTHIVLEALKHLDITAVANGRNDLVVQEGDLPRKFSGSAYRETQDRGFHHGTLLLHADLNRLAGYLTPSPKKLAAKGISSVRSRVTNLDQIRQGINHDLVSGALIESYLDHFNVDVDVEYLSPYDHCDLPGLDETFGRYSSWEWNFGKTPEFTHLLDERFNWGGVEVFLNVTKGRIQDARLYTDSLDPSPFEQLAENIKGSGYNQTELGAHLELLIANDHANENPLKEFRSWFMGAIA
ncbi:lipoate--protein ligase [Granulosicoccus sp. 3-233]|uniref:lipoate--protein ligase n=1 Tax=Granulosicoccus sp. 3-233 TaxID=3417969 RepID=UPI003D34F973